MAENNTANTMDDAADTSAELLNEMRLFSAQMNAQFYNMDVRTQNARIIEEHQRLAPLRSIDISPTAIAPVNTLIPGFPINVAALMQLNGTFVVLTLLLSS
jgi:hypothetical protein